MKEKTVVAIYCIVYNHEPYLRDCFEGFVMQKTNFRYVAIVHDDVSTDKSADIIREYAEKYPDIFKPIFETENQWSKHDGSLDRIMSDAIAATGAKYIAFCEGDDYWTDPYKLQKQVDFLEGHEEYSLCFHRVKCLMNDTGELKDEYMVGDMPGESTLVDIAKGNYIHTPSVVYRYNEEITRKILSLGRCFPGDYILWVLIAEKGKIWKMEEPMAVYRIGSGVLSTSHSPKNDLWSLCTLNKLYAVLENHEAKKEIEKQIISLQDFWGDYVEESVKKMQQSKAYRLGKAMLAPFSWIRKALNV